MITGTGKENEETFIEFDDGGRLVIPKAVDNKTAIENAKGPNNSRCHEQNIIGKIATVSRKIRSSYPLWIFT
jgi:hypothetical protein